MGDFSFCAELTPESVAAVWDANNKYTIGHSSNLSRLIYPTTCVEADPMQEIVSCVSSEKLF